MTRGVGRVIVGAMPAEPLIAKRAPDEPEREDGTRVDVVDDTRRDRPRIRCPLCMWVPRASDRWACYCGCSWNTFDTGGRCPECGFQFRHTMCLECKRWSKHVAWYADEPST
ncbi:MAG TPA: hypothetical protein RMH99_14195 [Sandaracinaceae bacterium LLY-WYZ-13_1]|nr:hypothetical protein [Sandaracinaceae bacterium LLY-WYZ-13_1]